MPAVDSGTGRGGLPEVRAEGNRSTVAREEVRNSEREYSRAQQCRIGVAAPSNEARDPLLEGAAWRGRSAEEPKDSACRIVKQGAKHPELSSNQPGSSDAHAAPLEDESFCCRAFLKGVERRRLQDRIEESWFQQFRDLRDPKQLFLLEVACSETSVLTAEVERRGLKGMRCSHLNGYDLSTVDGVCRLLHLIRAEKPDHVWISTECGAFSPMQNINQRTPEQIQRLEEKKRQDRIQHVGGLIVAWFAHRQGSAVHWEWSRRCRAWRWKLLETWRRTCRTHTAVISSCQVGLKDPKSGRPIGKEWRVETSSATFAKAIHLPCPNETCKQKHAPSESRTLSQTAFYSPDFARRIVHHMIHDSWHIPDKASLGDCQRESQELQGMDGTGCLCEMWRAWAPKLKCPSCLGLNEKLFAHVAHERDKRETKAFTREEEERVKKQLSHLHRATGHGSYESLVKSLESRRADPRVISLAKDFKCSTCEERKRPGPRRLSNMEVNTERCKVVQFDAAWWTPPAGDGKQKCQFIVMIDEASRFAVGKVFRKDGGGHMKAQDVQNVFHELWEPCFGLPEVMRSDPDGACRSRDLDLHLQSLGISSENVPADAHWKVSVVERAIQWIKELMSKSAAEEPGWTHEAILAQAVRTWNQREPVRGYSPFQWMMGRAPDFDDRMFVPDIHKLPGSLLQHPEHGVKRSEDLRRFSEKAFVDWQFREKTSRARNAKPRDFRIYGPGDLVYYWRRQHKEANTGIRKGAFAGPARILAMETKEVNGGIAPTSSVWLVRGMRLIKCAVEQLRPASEREVLLHELSEESQSPPWTTTKLVESLGPHDYDDLTGEGVPTTEDFEPGGHADDLPDVEMPQSASRRISQKRPPDLAASSSTSHRRGVPPESRRPADLPQGASWMDLVHDIFWAKEESASWQDEAHVVEVKIDLPTTRNQQEQFFKNAEAFVVKNLKKNTIEVSERRMTPEEKLNFSQAKGVEVRKFVAAKALEALPPEARPSRDQAVRMRWVLTYKLQEDGTKKPKARAVLLGYMDPEYHNRPSFAPTMTRHSRQLLLQFCSWQGMSCWKGDVSGAFLQGETYERNLLCEPVPELCEAMNIPRGSMCRLRKACYGLVEAPIVWFQTVNKFLCSIGYRQLRSDPCAWIYQDPKTQNVISLISGHVDDFLFAGKKDCDLWQSLRRQIQQRFDWQEWEEDHFVQCGVQISRQEDGSFSLSQKQYLEGVAPIPVSRERRRAKHEPTNEQEKTQLRGLLGALSWHVGQVGYKFAAHVGLSLSEVPNSCVEHLEKANNLLHQARQESAVPMRIHAFKAADPLTLVAWCDASSQNRHDGSSTEGIFVGMSTSGIAAGEISYVSPMFWKSGKIDRVCRSPGSAEARAAVDAEDNLYMLRYAWAEFCGYEADPWEPDALVKLVPAVLVTDSRNVYDKLEKPYITPKGASKKIDIELLALKESQRNTSLDVRWVNSDAQLANTLTKRGEEHQVARFIALGQRWRIVFDENMFSGKRRKAQGKDPLE